MSAQLRPLPESVAKSVANSKCEYRRLGNSGLRVSVPIFGAMSLGSSQWLPWVLDEDKAVPLLKAAYDRGLNTWDTSCNYSNGVSEEVIGKALKQYNIPREKVVLLTKCHGMVSEEVTDFPYFRNDVYRNAKDYVNKDGLSRIAIFNAVNNSLKRLQTDYIDLLQIHRFDYNTPIEETMKALHDLVESGKVRYIGASSMWAFQFAMMQAVAEKNGWTKFISMQGQYNLLYREEEREMKKYCDLTGVGLIPWSPLARGNLCRPPAESGKTERSKGTKLEGTSLKIVERVEELAKKKGWTMTDVALAWENKRVSSPIIGFSSVKRIDEAIAARGKTLTDEEEKYLEEPYQPQQVNGHF
ncbi:MAG: hypothetical protein M1819_003466 [Sarea resinae]|nr:MAG: hypothetical protein M1819_003466 [Sarea resinae]